MTSEMITTTIGERSEDVIVRTSWFGSPVFTRK